VISTVSSNLANFTFCSSGTRVLQNIGALLDCGVRLGDVLSSFSSLLFLVSTASSLT